MKRDKLIEIMQEEIYSFTLGGSDTASIGGFPEAADRIHALDQQEGEETYPRYGNDGLHEGPSGSPNPIHPPTEVSEEKITIKQFERICKILKKLTD